MTFEVLIPCYNSEACIERALASVQAQTHAPDVITLHDDRSADATPRILERLATQDRRIRVLGGGTANVGILRSRQNLVAAASGDVLCFLDHDDAWPRNYLESLEAVFRHANVEVSVAPGRNVDVNGRERSRVRPRAVPLRHRDFEDGIRRIFVEYPVPTWSCVAVRRRTALRLGELTGFYSGEEFALLALALERGDVELLAAPFVDRQLGTSNASFNADRQCAAELTLLSWFSTRYPFLKADLPAKVASIYGNNVYRHLLSGEVAQSRIMLKALLRGVCHRKVVGAVVASILGPRLVRMIRPVR